MEEKIVHQLPKIELHCHLDGSVPMETLEKFVEQQHMDKAVLADVVAPEKCEDLNDYLKGFDIILQFMQSAENLEEATYATIDSAATENVRYMELRFAPLLHTEKGLGVAEVIAAVSQGARRAMDDYPITVNLLICGMRQNTNEETLAMLGDVVGTKEPLVVGFDLAGPELDFAHDRIEPLTIFAQENNLQLTLHAGECGCAHNVVQSIRLGAKRIGHGIATYKDLEAQTLCVEKGTLIELCPTSNVQTNAVKDWDDYPLLGFLEKGIKCCISTDNRTVSQTTLTKEYVLLAEKCGIGYAVMKELNLNGLEGAFTTVEVKKDLRNLISKEYGPVSEI